MISKEKTVAELLMAIADDDRPIWPWALPVVLITTLIVCFFALAVSQDDIGISGTPTAEVLAGLVGYQIVSSIIVAAIVWLPFSLLAFGNRPLNKKMAVLWIAALVALGASTGVRYLVVRGQHNIAVEFHNGVVERLDNLQTTLDADFDRLAFVPLFGGGTTPDNIDERQRTTRASMALLAKFQQDLAAEEARDRRDLAELSVFDVEKSRLGHELDVTFATDSPMIRRTALLLAALEKSDAVLPILRAHQGQWRVENGNFIVAPGPTYDQLARGIRDYLSAAAALQTFNATEQGTIGAAPATPPTPTYSAPLPPQ